jgi:hypothetical protein
MSIVTVILLVGIALTIAGIIALEWHGRRERAGRDILDDDICDTSPLFTGLLTAISLPLSFKLRFEEKGTRVIETAAEWSLILKVQLAFYWIMGWVLLNSKCYALTGRVLFHDSRSGRIGLWYAKTLAANHCTILWRLYFDNDAALCVEPCKMPAAQMLLELMEQRERILA